MGRWASHTGEGEERQQTEEWSVVCWRGMEGRIWTVWKPMPVVGPGAREIRIRVLGEWRVIYVARFANAVYVLHAFHKKSQKTRREDIELAQQRLREV